MPGPISTTTPVTPTTTTTPTSTGPLGCGAFKKDPTLTGIATRSTPALTRGAPTSDTVKTVQAALFSLGFIKLRVALDGAFGPGTETSLKAFQKSVNVPQTGAIDAATLKALDKASTAQIARLKAATSSDDSKNKNFRLVADLSDPSHTRLYVLGANDQVTARYLVSPGTDAYPTHGNHFHITDVFTRTAWNPPNSGWAQNAKPIPPGLDNPMGLTKLSMGAYAQYLHGIPASEEKDLGHAASHGCVRMSGSNVLELAEKYAGTGSDLTLLRDRTASAKLDAAFATSGLKDRPTDSGREYLFGYLSGELGSTRHATS